MMEGWREEEERGVRKKEKKKERNGIFARSLE
jgi:hypothetical protein